MQLEIAQQITLDELAALARLDQGRIKRLYLHWTAGRYTQYFDDYHLNIGRDGEILQTCNRLSDLKAHTWHRNTGAVGITLCCGLEATATMLEYAPPLINFGPYAPTQEQIESMAKVIAVISHEVGLEITEATVQTHQEAATSDGYGPGSSDPDLRWDLWYLPDLPLTPQLVQGGRVLRGKALWYQKQIYNHPAEH